MFRFGKKEPESDMKATEVKLSQAEIRKILRAVSLDKGFHFYEEEGNPTSQVARSLIEFRDRINTVTLRSLIFHLKRKDFQNWIIHVIGDSELAGSISNINTSSFDLQVKLYATISRRIRKLHEMLSYSTVASKDVPIVPNVSEAELSP